MGILITIVLMIIFGAPIIVMMLGLATWSETKVRKLDLETEKDFIKD